MNHNMINREARRDVNYEPTREFKHTNSKESQDHINKTNERKNYRRERENVDRRKQTYLEYHRRFQEREEDITRKKKNNTQSRNNK